MFLVFALHSIENLNFWSKMQISEYFLLKVLYKLLNVLRVLLERFPDSLDFVSGNRSKKKKDYERL